MQLALSQGYRFCLLWGLLMAVILGIGARSLAAFFNPDPEVIELAIRYLWLVPISYGAAGIFAGDELSIKRHG